KEALAIAPSTPQTLEGPVNYRVDLVEFRTLRENPEDPPSLTSPEAVTRLARTLIPDDAREHFIAFYLNNQNRLVAAHEVSVGTLNAALVHPREVLGPALRLLGVNALVVAHNHPSGDPTASREDREITARLAEAARGAGPT